MQQVSEQQGQAIKEILSWLKEKDRKEFFYLAGYAGTGKTTLAKIIADEVKGRVLFAAFTGKAAVVLQKKGCFGASTIHSLIYKPIEDKNGIITYVLNDESPLMDAKLLIIDECSMVGEELAADVLSYNVPILVLGDPAQLPPVKSEGYFTRGEPDFMLTEIHRQAKENPIIAMSMIVRNQRTLPVGTYGSSRVVPGNKFDRHDVMASDQVLCGLNRTRTATNERIRELKNFTTPYPVVGDRLVCLKNQRKLGLLNGGLWDVDEIKKRYHNSTSMIVKPVDAGTAVNPVHVYVHDYFFQDNANALDWKERKMYNEFDFGYALTVHKSQGSQWDNVLLFDESFAFREDRFRHLYTGITRAAEKITIVV